MSNRGLIITLIVILSIIAILLTILLIFAVTGRNNSQFVFNFGGKTDNIIFDESYDKASIKNIYLKSDTGDIDIKESQDEKVRVVIYGERNDNVSVLAKDEALKIDIKNVKRIFNFGIYKKDVIIYLPNDYSDTIDVEASYGDIDIENFENATMKVKEDCGNIKIQAVKDANIENSYGDIKVETITNKCNIKNNCGNIKIVNLDIKENSDIESDLGDIKIEKTSNVYVDAKVDLGDMKINENDRYSEVILKLRNNCGDIKVNY